jgi:hypothetical protein
MSVKGPTLTLLEGRFFLAASERTDAMPMVAYKVTPNGQKWLVTRDGEPGMSYVSQEAA